MLTNEALISALPLTEILDTRNLALIATEGSPLAALVKATRSDTNYSVQNAPSYTPDIGTIEYMANKKDDTLGYSPHDFVMDDLVNTCTAAVQQHLYFAKNIVAPAVAELVEKTMASMLAVAPSKLLGMEVVTWAPPKPLESSALESSLRRFEGMPYDVPALSMRLPSITAKEIIDLLGSGISSVDKDIAEWASIRGEGYFLNLWENVFQIKQAGLNDACNNTFRDWIEDKELGMDNALAIYLLSRRLADSDPLAGTEMSLPAFERLIIEFRDQSGSRLVRAMDEIDRSAKNGQLIRSTTDRVTVVNASIYREWIENGGENEILFGNLLDLPSVTNVETLNEKASALKQLWNRHSVLTATVESNRKYSSIKEILLTHFEEQIRVVPAGEEATLGNRENIVKEFNNQLNQVRSSEFNDLFPLCLKLVCRSRFSQTSAETILEGIERVQKENPNIDVREAAAVSAIEYIAQWMASQMKLVPA